MRAVFGVISAHVKEFKKRSKTYAYKVIEKFWNKLC